MAIATAALGATGLAGGAAKFFEGRKMQRQAQQLIDNFEWQDLENAYTNKQVSTLGSDLMREENSRAMATAAGALREGGSRALIGGLGKVVSQSNTMNRQIAANLDEQQKALDLAAAADDVNIRNMVEKRQTDELAGYGEMLQQGRSMKNVGLSEGLNAIGTLGAGVSGVISPVKGGTGLFGGAPPEQTISSEELTPLSGGMRGVVLPTYSYPLSNSSGVSQLENLTKYYNVINDLNKINNRPR